MSDHLVEPGNLRDACIALIIGLALAALGAMLSSPQQMGSKHTVQHSHRMQHE